MIINKQDIAAVDFSDFSGGLNSTDPQCAIKPNQAYSGSINARWYKKGFGRAPGFHGIASTPTFEDAAKGLDIYSRIDGTDSLISYSGGKVYSVNKENNKTTELYNLTGSGECYGVSFYDKFFAVNGAKACVIEGTSGYPIGIAPPEGVLATAAAGGSLPTGVYKIYAGYARKVAGSNVQFSVGQFIADVTLTTGSRTIAVTNFANSSDARVNNKILWMTDADGGVYYQYYQTNDNTTTSFNVTSDSTKNASVLYRVWGEPSKQPPLLTGIFVHDDRIFGWRSNVLYASMKATTVYDLERWPDIQYEFPFQILSLFAIGADLFINSNQGVIKLPNADMAARYEWITRRLYFKYTNTVRNIDDNSAENPTPVIGVTNDGVRIFNGVSFSMDLSKDIKTDIKKLITGSSSAFKPCGVVCRSQDRTEYRLSYRDTNINAVANNRTLVLNLDRLTINSNTEYLAPWELWQIGFQYAAIDTNGSLFMCQSLSTAAQIMREHFTTVDDLYVYRDEGTFLSAASNKKCIVKSRMEITDISGSVRWNVLRALAQLSYTSSIEIKIGNEINLSSQYDLSTVDQTAEILVWDQGNWDEAIWGADQLSIVKQILKANLKGPSVIVTFTQEANDINLQVIEIKLYGKFESGRYV